jgi:hypothetical protein
MAALRKANYERLTCNFYIIISAMEMFEKLPNGGCIARSVVNLAFPLSDRDYLVYISPPYETSD